MFVRNLASNLATLLQADTSTDLWPAAVALVEAAGYAALSIMEFSPGEGPLWAKSSMSERWLRAYATEGFHAVDPVFAAAMAGQREIRFQVGDRAPTGADGPKFQTFNRRLAETGYGQFDAMAFAHPARASDTLVTLVSPAAADDRAMVGLRPSRQLLMATLAAALHRLGPADDGGFL